MRYSNILEFILFSIFLIGCRNMENNMGNRLAPCLYVDIDKAEQFVSDEDSRLIDSCECELLQLECTTGIGSIVDLKFNKDRMILLDNNRQRLHIINKAGVCEHEISCLGRAANEYIEITDFFATDESVYILDMASLKVIEYDYNGTYMGKTQINEYWANKLFVVDENIFLINEGSDTKHGKKHIFEMQKDGEVVNSYIPFEVSPGLSCEYAYGLHSKDTILYAERESNTIYKISRSTCEPFLTLDFGNYNLPEKFKTMDARDLMFNTNQEYQKYALGIEKIFVSQKYIFVKFQAKNNNYLLVIDHKRKSIVFCGRGIRIERMFQLGLRDYYIHDNFIYDVYDKEDFISVVDYKMKESKNNVNDYMKQLHSLMAERESENWNPIIIKYKIKNE